MVAVTAVVGHLSAAAEEKQKAGSVELPIIMYHGILRDSKRQGKFVISPSEFEADLKYLTGHGYHTIVMQDLIDYVQNGTPLPEKPVMLTFDDGYFNNYVYAYPLLQQYQCKMVLSPIGRYADEYSESGEENANYSNATWARLKEMADSGLVEIQNILTTCIPIRESGRAPAGGEGRASTPTRPCCGRMWGRCRS